MSTVTRKSKVRRPRRVAIVACVVMVASSALGTRGAGAGAPSPGIVRPGSLIPIVAPMRPGPARSVGAPRAMTNTPVVKPAAAPTSTFKVTYTGFSAEAQAAFQAAVDYWSTTVSSSVPITVNATFADLGTVGGLIILGSAGASSLEYDFAHAPVAHTLYPVALANRLAQTDLDPAHDDIVALFTSNPLAPWYFGTDGLPGPTELDFESVVKHELAHGLGFFGSMGVDSSGVGSYGYGTGYPLVYDRFATKSATPLLSYANNSLSLGLQLVSNDVYFKGVATGQSRLYAPIPYRPGSSFSHLDEITYPEGDPNALMTPQIDYGEADAAAGPITLNMFRDMGWSVPSWTTPHDVTADAHNDLISRTPAGNLAIQPGDGSGGLLPAVPVGAGFNSYNRVLITPDWNGDGKSDLIARAGDGRLWSYALGSGPSSAVQIATGWKAFTAVVAPGDFNGDGKYDLIARTADGKLKLYRGNGTGGFVAPPVQIATGWKAFTAVVAPGDFNGDGQPDLIARTADGKLKLYRGNGSNGFTAPAAQIGTGWNGLTLG